MLLDLLIIVLLAMLINIHWGNLQELSYHNHIQKIIQKNVDKVSKLIGNIDKGSIRLEMRLHFDQAHKKYTVILNFHSPKSHHYIAERGYTLEETLKESTLELRRKVRKYKEKRIDRHRQHVSY